MNTPAVPVPKSRAALEAELGRNALLLARYVELERELEVAPFHRVNTFWWDERTKEMRSINHRLGK